MLKAQVSTLLETSKQKEELMGAMLKQQSQTQMVLKQFSQQQKDGDLPQRITSADSVSKYGHRLVVPGMGNNIEYKSLSCPQCSADVSLLMTQSDEYKILSSEKDRLLEMVQVLQIKEMKMNQKCLEGEKKYQEERRKLMVLQQELERMKVDAK
uniref:Coiled-coil domain containing 13 n=1 Tax=Iconisemion striatum TaxID=60296 RepID=A0A1A7Z1X6_9TELE